jgi:hypothetical protein
VATKSDQSDDKSLLETARKRFSLAEEAESEIRKLEIEDLRFRAGEQWPADVQGARNIDKRPCLTINRLPQFIHQITNDQRQNRPSIKVSPVDDGADVDTAKILQGLIRHIEYNSNADVAYDRAFEGAVTKGRGYFRVITDYCDPTSFEQDIFIKSIRNSMSVYVDPSYQEPDGSDMNWGFIFEDVPEDDYKAEYGEEDLESLEAWRASGDEAADWANGKTIRVAEYFYKEYENTTLCLLSDKTVVLKSDLEGVMLPDGVAVVAERQSLIPKIKWCKINAVRVLEKTDWPGQWIPIIPVHGDEIELEGKRIFEGVIRHAKDPQRMYNYWASAETEAIALAPKAPFIGAEGQFKGYEKEWATANQRSFAFLQYVPKTIGGVAVPPPQRNHATVDTGAITNARALSSEDLKATTGIYDAALGNRSNENSGIAIQRRNIQAQTSNFHFVDNLSRAIRHTGRILVELIPHVYDTARAVRVIGEDGEQQIVQINQIFQENGKPKSYNLGAGKYDVTVETGPSFATKRQEAVESMLQLTKAYPQVAGVAGDLMVKNMDWPGAKEIAERLKKTLPPGIAEPDEKDQQPLPPEVQNQMAQMNQMIEQLTEQLKHKTEQIDQKTLELESRERIEMAKLATNAELEMAKLGSQESLALLQHQVAQIEAQLDRLHMAEASAGLSDFGNEPLAAPDQGAPADFNQPTDGNSSGQLMEQ